MIVKMFSLLDLKAKCFSHPFYAAHDAHAHRMVGELACDRNNQVGRYPTEFMLYEIGTFDDQVGFADMLQAPIQHGLAVIFIPADPQLTIPVMPSGERPSRPSFEVRNGQAGPIRQTSAEA